MSEKNLADRTLDIRSSESFTEAFPTWKHKVGLVGFVAAGSLVLTLGINLVVSGDPLNRPEKPSQIEEPTTRE